MAAVENCGWRQERFAVFDHPCKCDDRVKRGSVTRPAIVNWVVACRSIKPDTAGINQMSFFDSTKVCVSAVNNGCLRAPASC